MPYNHHVAKFAQSTAVMLPKPCQINQKVGPMTFLKDGIICKGDFF